MEQLAAQERIPGDFELRSRVTQKFSKLKKATSVAARVLPRCIHHHMFRHYPVGREGNIALAWLLSAASSSLQCISWRRNPNHRKYVSLSANGTQPKLVGSREITPTGSSTNVIPSVVAVCLRPAFSVLVIIPGVPYDCT